MTRTIDSLTHTPGEHVNISISYPGGEEDIKVSANATRATVTAEYKYTPDEAIMATDRLNAEYDDRDEVHEAFRDALNGLNASDEVLQTIDRLRRLGHWMDNQDPVMPDDVIVDVYGNCKPLRSGQDMLLVDDDGTAYKGQNPFVKVADNLPPVDDLRDDLDQTVETRVKRRMCGQQRIHYEEREESVESVITEVESLQEAVQIVRCDRYGEDIDSDSDGSEEQDAGGQATLTGF